VVRVDADHFGYGRGHQDLIRTGVDDREEFPAERRPH
jgi:hypothetical protein